MTSKALVQTVLSGKKAERPPVSFWHHFGPTELRGRPAVDAHLRHLAKFQPDFLKVMNDTGFPRPSEDWVLSDASELKEFKELTGAEAEFEMEYDVLRQLRREAGPDVPVIVTVFNSWAILRRLTAPESDIHGPPKIGWEDERDATLTAILQEDRQGIGEALATLGRGLAKFAKRAIEAGADGVFLSVRDDWVDSDANGEGVYDHVVMPSDLEVLEGAKGGWFNMLHVCGKAKDFVRFGGYPAHILNWADRYSGPSITEAKGMTEKPLSGGVDNLNTLPKGGPIAVEIEVQDAIRQAGTRPLMVTPGCTYAPELVSDGSLFAMIAAAIYR